MNNLKIKTVAILIISSILCGSLMAQNTDKELKKELKSRVDRDSRKEAKRLSKAGWEVMPGKLSLDRQIQDSRYAELSTNEDGERQYFTATHSSVGGNYSSAKKIASSRALIELAEQVSTEIASIVENNVSNMNFGDADIEVIDKCISASKQIVVAKLSGAVTTLDIFRQNDGNCEVRVMYKMSVQNSIKLAKEVYREELGKESTELSNKLDGLIK